MPAKITPPTMAAKPAHRMSVGAVIFIVVRLVFEGRLAA
jgi:hypothetical protein